MNKRILVLGGSGFLGSHVVDGLRMVQGVDIWSMDRSPERFRHSFNNVTYFRNEFGNRGAQEDILSRGVDTVVHLISSTTPASSNKDPIYDIQSNLVETVAFLDLAVKYNVKRIVFVSSGGTIYGQKDLEKIPESASLWPMCSYGIVKSAIEKYLHMYHQLHGIETVSVRLANPYGPRQDPTKPLGAISVFLYRYLKGLPIEIWGDGSVSRDYLFIEDFRDAITKCILVESIDGCFNVGSGESSSLNDVISVMRSLGYDPDVHYMDSRPYDIKKVVLDCSKANDTLGWTPKFSLEQGITKSFNWMKEMLEEGKID